MKMEELKLIHNKYMKDTQEYERLNNKYRFYLEEYEKIKYIDCSAADELKRNICTLLTARLNMVEKFKAAEVILNDNKSDGEDYYHMKSNSYSIAFLSKDEYDLLIKIRQSTNNLTLEELKMAKSLLDDNEAVYDILKSSAYNDISEIIDAQIRNRNNNHGDKAPGFLKRILYRR